MVSLRVAIADDDRGMREALQQMLSNLGHEVVAMADNGRSLVNQCMTTVPDVVITGTLTPEMYGADAAEAIYKARPIPIILYSGHCEPELVINAEHKHVFTYLVKPICQEHLETALKECQCTEPSEPTEDDLRKVPVGPALESLDSESHQELRRPPYQRRPR